MSPKQVIYYVDAQGQNPVLKDMGSLSLAEQQKILAYISLLEEKGEELRRPIADYVGDKLYELRPQKHRVLYFFMLKNSAVIVHVFRKKTAKLPEREKDIALKRMHDFLDRYQKNQIKIGDDST